ncbi:subunit pseudouridine synthase E [Seminavis robusta]|uniref:Subunit pseudouridine synthase E n=1 Tax=Seminavis robusta TaxID=568900 RepID=A0A9N8I0H1_9STRA|nr:subunit pseudouridine synthase E [Seminavis robusta]|eukprot:Sro3885_g351680.1 subunit pseudouridine synthase E (236) ;mRNA; r:1042-1749
MEGQDSRARVRAHSHGNLNNNGRPPLLPVGGATTTVTTGVLPANHNSKDTTSKHQHFKLYKPAKVLTQFVFTHRTRKKRTLLGDVLRGTATCTADSSEPVPIPLKWPMGTMAIGRLDEDSEGLLLLTTDGTVSERVRRTSVEKEYWVQLDGQITEQALHRLCHGVPISLPTGPKCDKDQGGRSTYTYTTLPCQARVLDTVVVRVNATSTTAKAKNPSAGPVAVSKRKRKRKTFGG